MMTAEVNDPKAAELLSLAARNFNLFPVWHVRPNGVCGCGNAKCTSPGKHPLGHLVPKGCLDATHDEQRILAWHASQPQANWGAATGKRLVVIDVDRKNGHDGEAVLKELEAELGALPFTLQANTPTGGYHLYFQCEEELQNSASRLGKGVDIRATGGYVVCPPSEVGAGRYTWEDDSVEIEKLPEKWIERLLSLSKKSKPKRNEQGVPDAVIGEGGRNQHLFKLGCSVRGAGASAATILELLLIDNAERCYPPLDEAEVKAIAESVARYEAPPPPNDPTAEPPPEAHIANAGRTDDWKALLQFAGKGIKNTVGNVITILANDDRWDGVIGYDEFLESPVFLKPPPFAGDYGGGRGAGEIEDADDGRIVTWLGRTWGINPGTSSIASAVLTVSKNNTIHPVRNYLSGLRWDGTERLSSWLSTYLGVRSTKLSSRVGRWFLISMVARVFKPGCQVDTVMILEGAQGRGKSSAMRILGSPWFTDELPNLRDAQAVGQNLRGVWLTELGELTATISHSNETVKRVLSQREDRYRPSYGRRVRAFARQCVFVGTTNRDDYLSDPTGHRRWVPVRVGEIDLSALERDRDQLFAEAKEAFESGGAWWAQDDEERSALAAQAASRETGDAWISEIADYLASERIKNRLFERGMTRPDGHGREAPGWAHITGAEILSECLKIEPGRWGQRETMRLGDCMLALGWRRRQGRVGGARFWAYEPPCQGESEDAEGGD